MDNQLAIFEQKPIRKALYKGEMYFSIVDIIEVLTNSHKPRNYWSDLKRREKQLHDVCVQLKLLSSDGKHYKTDCANVQGVFRILMAVPSPKAEPFKLWLAEVGKQTLEEIDNPELAVERARELYRLKGYSDEWIDARLKSIEVRKQLTDEWQERGVKEHSEYAILTAEISKATFGLTPSEHKDLKQLNRQNL